MTDTQQNWAAVPVLVGDLFVKYAASARQCANGEQNYQEGWAINTPEVRPVLIKRAVEQPDVQNIPATPQTGLAGVLPSMSQVSDGWRTAQAYMGGPNPLTSMLLSGALMGTLGYGGGWVLNKLMPGVFDKSTAGKWGAIGGLGGAGAAGLIHAPHAIKNDGIMGLLKTQPFQRKPKEPVPETPKPGMVVASSYLGAVLDNIEECCGLSSDPADYEKHASAGGDLYGMTIETDDWGRAVFRDPFLADAEKALAAGLPAAAGAMRGSKYVSPRDVATVAVNAGLGYGYGYLGSLAAKFLGMSAPMQKGLQNAGLLAGAVRGVTGMR